MPRKRTFKNRKSLRRSRRKSRGGGYSDIPNSNTMINPGNIPHDQYSGAGKDCAGVPMRPGYLTSMSPSGLPGLSGLRGGRRRNKYKGGGASYPVTNPKLPPVSSSLTPKPSYFPDTTGKGGTVMNMAGGRYGFFPGDGPLNPINGVGTSPAPFSSIPCERGTSNPLNPNPNGVQQMTTAPFVSGRLAGGGNFPLVNVGDVNSMRYYAPTAGYTNGFTTFPAPSPVPGYTTPIQYPAHSFNRACLTTGGSRKRGGSSVSQNAGPFTPVTMSEIRTRRDFDGTNGLLPVKFGGRRKTHHKRRKY